MRRWVVILAFIAVTIGCKHANSTPDPVLAVSEELLLQVKKNNPTSALQDSIAELDQNFLISQLNADSKKKAFWLNVYNAYYQIIASRGPVDLDSVFINKQIEVAGELLSFDDIEHGILRNKEGYSGSQFTVDSVDFRIHFALNCGAKSCPPIAFYEASRIDEQLEAATKLYLTVETEVNRKTKTLVVTRLMDWFSEDFGGMEALPMVLSQYLEEDLSAYTIEFKDFDWTQNLGNFQ